MSPKPKPAKKSVANPAEPLNGVRGKSEFPKLSVKKALRIPQAILDQNAGRECDLKKAASFLGVKPVGRFNVEIAASTKFGFLDRPKPGFVQPTGNAKRALRPQQPGDEKTALREAVLQAPLIGDVYRLYRGEYLPEEKFLRNTLVEQFSLEEESIDEFLIVFRESLDAAELTEMQGERLKLLDVVGDPQLVKGSTQGTRPTLDNARVNRDGESCFVIQPFAKPHGDYFSGIFKPAIEKAGLRAIRADADIFGTGKIMDQVWDGINSAKVLVAELTTRNPNVFYELGLAHALKKPVVLVSATMADVPFDLQQIRVILYDVNDPFWGSKLIEKVAENIESALRNPEEVIYKTNTKNSLD